MILPDVNVLIYAFRPDAQHHAICKPWLDRVVLNDAAFGLSPLTLSAVARVATDHRIYSPPSPIENVLGFCDDLRHQPHCHLIEPGEHHWDIFKRLCLTTDIRGPRITDAWYAALAIEWDCEWITFDRDYARFPGLRWRTPTAA